MTPAEAAKWFRRSLSWLRLQDGLVRLGGPNGQPLFHVRACRAYVLARMCGYDDAKLRLIQLQAMADACGVAVDDVERSVLEAAPERIE